MKNNKGFTLVELLAVIAILAILVIMALPAVLRMFEKARIDSFTNEVNVLVRTTEQQYLLGGGIPQSFNSSSNKLPLTGNSSLEYCVSIDGNGKITELKATNGNYKYESSGTVDEVHSTEVSTAESNYELSCAGGNTSSLTYVNRQNEGSITVGDEVAIDTEHFYVISSDETNTVLLAKYNLLVGDVYNSSDGGSTWTFTKTLTTSDAGYGLQSETAKGYYSGATDYTGVVAFSGKGYWDNANCVSNGSGESTCPGTRGLKSEYANSANAAGKTGSYSTPYPYVYESSMSSVAPTYTYGNPYGYAQDNGYTIAYYVEGYVNRLKSLGAPNNITGRLLTYEEANSLSSTIKGNWSYWLGSALHQSSVRRVIGGSVSSHYFWIDNVSGVRPVIVVSTSEI